MSWSTDSIRSWRPSAHVLNSWTKRSHQPVLVHPVRMFFTVAWSGLQQEWAAAMLLKSSPSRSCRGSACFGPAAAFGAADGGACAADAGMPAGSAAASAPRLLGRSGSCCQRCQWQCSLKRGLLQTVVILFASAAASPSAQLIAVFVLAKNPFRQKPTKRSGNCAYTRKDVARTTVVILQLTPQVAG